MRLPRNVASKALDYRTLQAVTFEAISPMTTQKEAKRLLKQEMAAGNVPRPGTSPPPGSYDPKADGPYADDAGPPR